MTTLDQLYESLSANLTEGVVVLVGVGLGRHMQKFLRNAAPGVRTVATDDWGDVGGIVDTMKKEAPWCFGRVTLNQGPSHVTCTAHAFESVDAVVFERPVSRGELQQWMGKVKVGGLMAYMQSNSMWTWRKP